MTEPPAIPAAPGPAPGPWPRWMRWLLVASLALNLLVAGLLAGAALRDDGPGGPPRPVELSLGPLTRALDPEDRQAVLRDLRGRGDLGAPTRAERAAAAAELAAILRATPFDRGRAAAVLAAQAGRVAQVEREVEAALLGRLEAMPPEARAAFAERLEREARRGPRGSDQER